MSALAQSIGGGLIALDLVAMLLLFLVIAVVYRAVTSASTRVAGGRAVARDAHCGNCGWMGSVSAFAPTCPLCNARLEYSAER